MVSKANLTLQHLLVVTPILEDYEIVLSYSQSATKMIYLATQAKLWAYP